MLQSVQREKSNASGEVADASRRLDEAAGRVDSLEDENARLQQQLTVARAEVAQHKKVGMGSRQSFPLSPMLLTIVRSDAFAKIIAHQV